MGCSLLITGLLPCGLGRMKPRVFAKPSLLPEWVCVPVPLALCKGCSGHPHFIDEETGSAREVTYLRL